MFLNPVQLVPCNLAVLHKETENLVIKVLE